MSVQLLAGHAGLNRAIQILGADADDLRHAGEIDGNTTPYRAQMALEGGTGAECDDRHAFGRAEPHGFRYVLRVFRKDDCIRNRGDVVGFTAAMLLPQGLRCGEAVTETVV